jgi:PAS domain S-box-containing protein
MSGPRILALLGFLLAVAGLLLGPFASVAPAFLCLLLAAVLVFAATVPSAAGTARSTESGVRATFGPALDTLETLAVFTVDHDGRIGYVNRGAARLAGKPARDLEGRPAGVVLYSDAEDPEVGECLREVFESARPLAARRFLLFSGGGPRVESVLTMAPIVRYGKVVEVAVLRADTRGGGVSHERQARLLDSVPAGLLGVDGAGRIDAVNRRLADLLGRRPDSLEGLDVERTEVLPSAVRALLKVHAGRPAHGTPAPPAEEEILVVTAEGVTRPFHVLVAPRAGGGADAVFVDGSSRRRLRTELEAARQSLAQAREAAAEAIATTTQEIKDKILLIVEAARRSTDESSGPVQRRSASAELKASTEQLLASVEADALRAVSARPRPPHERAVVLLVEDNEENRELLAHMLRSRGAEVVAVGTGREAVEAAARFPFSFVLLDLQMPEMDGFQVLHRLRALPGGDRVPVVALTALTSDLVKERCEAEGMNDFVSKPVTLARVGELVGKWGRRAEA